MKTKKDKKITTILRLICISMLVLNGCSEYTEVERFTADLSPSFGGIKIGETRMCLVVIEANEDGKERAYTRTATSHTWVSPEWVRAVLLD